jgi:ribosomal protein S18 acetylase RimI-like enzyme
MTAQEQALVSVLDRAFADDPFLAYLSADPVQQVKIGNRLHTACLRYALRFGVPEVAPDNAGVALWLPPGHEHLTYSRMFQTGVAQFGLSLGLGALRLLKVDNAITAMHKKHAPGQHWYLFFLAVAPDHHRRGIGGALLEQGKERAAAEGLPIYLETMTEANVRFYTKRGFEVQEETAITPEFKVWGLRWAQR